MDLEQFRQLVFTLGTANTVVGHCDKNEQKRKTGFIFIQIDIKETFVPVMSINALNEHIDINREKYGFYSIFRIQIS